MPEKNWVKDDDAAVWHLQDGDGHLTDTTVVCIDSGSGSFGYEIGHNGAPLPATFRYLEDAQTVAEMFDRDNVVFGP
jgi:hypothetical protein